MVLPDSYRISRVPQYLGTQPKGAFNFSLTGLSPSPANLSRVARLSRRLVTPRHGLHTCQTEPHYPGRTTRAGFNVRSGLGCSLFARRYWGNRGCFLFLGLLRCFSSPRSPQGTYGFSTPMIEHYLYRVAPFGLLRIYGCLHLPGDYRSLPRPSSPPDAKASTACS